MAKYYVQSGRRRLVVSAIDPQAAALWLVHRTLDDLIPKWDESQWTEEMLCEAAFLCGLSRLGNTVQVSERGFGRQDSGVWELLELVDSWHQLMTALLRWQTDSEQG